MPSSCWSPLLERALRVSATAHQGQTRKGSTLPYFSHPAAVALILVRAGFDDDAILAAAVLHDTLEDTEVTEDFLQAEFPSEVSAIVEGASERKRDEDGKPLPWHQRKQEHIERVRGAVLEVRAVILADKLHNRHAITTDQASPDTVWNRFNASRADVLRYHDEIVSATCPEQQSEIADPRLAKLATESRTLIQNLR